MSTGGPARNKGVGDAFERGRPAFPGVSLDRAAFEAHLARHGDLHPESLYLACAAGHGDPKAIAELEARYLSRVGAAVARLRGPSTLADDTRQALREALFVAAPGRPPRILEYAGKSELATWLHAAAVRTALTLLRRRATDGAGDGDEELISSAVAPGDPQLDRLKAHDVERVKAAFSAALRALPDADRAHLRQYYVERLGVEEMGLVHRVAPSTISRRLAKARDALLERVRAELARELKLSADEADSLVRSVRSRLELSRISQLFAPG